jgi:hypothetical protein
MKRKTEEEEEKNKNIQLQKKQQQQKSSIAPVIGGPEFLDFQLKYEFLSEEKLIASMLITGKTVVVINIQWLKF